MAEPTAWTLLVLRLVRRDLRRRAVESVLLLVAVTVATTTLTIGLVLHGESIAPYARTRAATAGPDVTASAFPTWKHPISAGALRALGSLGRAPGVTSRSGPYPVTWAGVRFGPVLTGAELEGRDPGRAAAVDQPALLSGGWVRRGQAVVEGSFADALGVRVGDTIRIGARSFLVAGTAVTAAFPPYPQMCTIGCIRDTPTLASAEPGLVWLTRADLGQLAIPAQRVTYFMNLRLHSPGAAPAFAAAHGGSSAQGPTMVTWEDLSARQAELLQNEQALVLLGSSLLGVLAIATLVVLVGGRMSDELRRVGIFKAVGSTPGFIATVLLAEYLTVALVAAGIGLVAGRLCAPLLTTPGAGLLGDAGSPSLTWNVAGVVCAVAFGVTVLATLAPALRAARVSTVQALADVGRPPKRRRALISLSAHLPPTLLVGVRLAGRRPRRALLSAASFGVAVCGIEVVLFAQAKRDAHGQNPTSGLLDPYAQRLGHVMLVLSVLLTIMAAVNLVFVATATALDNRTSLAVTRALGATPGQAAAGLGAAQVIPALLGAALGLPAGYALFSALNHAGTPARPPLWWLGTLPVGTVVLAAVLTAIPAGLGARRSVADVLRSEPT